MENLIFKNPQLSNNSLCYDFQDVAIKTWNLLGNAHNNNFSIGEETITDINLLELKMRRPHLVITRKFSRQQEGINGADWVWIIIGRNGRTFMLYVQAKKLFTRTLRYESLLHDRVNPAEQLDKLVFNKFFYPMGYPVYPIYVFYNYFTEHPPLIPCNCGTGLPVELAGCAYADAFSIRPELIALRDHVSNIYPHQFAWSCLVCCDSKGGKKSDGKDLATTYFDRIVNQNLINEVYRRDVDSSRYGPFSSESFLLKEPPSFVNRMLSGKENLENPFVKLDVDAITILQEKTQ